MVDANDLHQKNELPADHEAGAVVISTPASELDARTPRLGTFLEDAIARMKARGRGDEKAIATPWPALDAALGGGLWPGLHVLVGNTGSGKSQLALQLALNAARNGTPVLYVGLELAQLDLTARLAGLVERSRWSDYYHGHRIPSDTTRELLAGLPFYLDLRGPHEWTPDALDAPAAALRAEGGGAPFLVVLDFLQIVGDSSDRGEDLRQRIGRAAYKGSAIARRDNAAVLMLSSTARENAHALRGKARPSANRSGSEKPEQLGTGWAGRFQGLGKESGEIEYAADTLMALCEEGHEGAGPWPRWLAVAKIRAGASAWVSLDFNGNSFAERRADDDGKLIPPHRAR